MVQEVEVEACLEGCLESEIRPEIYNGVRRTSEGGEVEKCKESRLLYQLELALLLERKHD